jgi:bacillithiol biosynthesis cysteine-adding enzyme BshC
MCEYDVAVGKPPVAILRVARERSCDLIVMSSHGLTGARKLFFGSTTERVLRETTVPVLVTPPVNPGPVYIEDARRLLGRIVVPVDLSPASLHQTQVASGLAEALNLPLVLVHVIEPVKSALLSRLHLTGLDSNRRAVAEQSLDELAATLGTTDFTQDVVASLRAAYQPGLGMAEVFARWLESVLGPHGLVVFDSSDPAAKPLAADLFGREVRTAGRTAALAADAGNLLTSRGHEPQVVPQPGSVSLFYIDGVRRPIRRQGNDFIAGDRTFTPEALAEEAASAPHYFSPNVLLRPIVQDTLFPTVCYVAGPSELAYLGQLRQVYDSFGVPMPLMYPRATATLVDSATTRFLARYDIRLEDLQRQDESALNHLLESQLPQSVDAAIRDADAAIRHSMERVIDAMPEVDPTLAGAARTTLTRMEHDLRSLQGKMVQAVKRRDETLRRQFNRAQAQIFPLGHAQERTLGVIYFLNRYGPGVVDRLLAELPLDLGQHWVMTV